MNDGLSEDGSHMMIPREKVERALQRKRCPPMRERLKCPRCPKRFTTLWNVKRHYWVRHEKKRSSWAVRSRQRVRKKQAKSRKATTVTSTGADIDFPALDSDMIKLELDATAEGVEMNADDALTANDSVVQEEVQRRMTLSRRLARNAIKNVKCSECPKTFTTVWNMKRHFGQCHDADVFLTLASGRKKWRLKCPQCPKWFSTSFNLRRHFEPEHMGILYMCDVCGVDFKTKQALGEHEQDVHSAAANGEPRHKCSECDKTFVQVCDV